MIAVAKARQYRDFDFTFLPLIDERRRGRCGERGAAGGLQG